MREANAYTDGASTGSRGPGGYGAVISWCGKTVEISGGERDTTNLRMELTAACAALETIGGGHGSPSTLPGQLHEEGLAREMAEQRVDQPPKRNRG